MQAVAPREFLSLTLEAPAVDQPKASAAPAKAEHDIGIEVRRGTGSVTVTGRSKPQCRVPPGCATGFDDPLMIRIDAAWLATAKALDYSLRRWVALTRFVDDGQLPVDNNWIENQIRPIAIGRSNWLFAGSLRAGQRVSAVMSLIQSARMNGCDPYAYLKDVLTRLPTHKASRTEELLPHRWQSTSV